MSILDLRRLADVSQKESFSNRMRSRRFSKFEGLLENLPRPIKIIDIGGTVRFWEQRGWTERDDVDITLINLHAEQSPYPHIRGVAGDATKLSAFGDRQFDIAFSNSVIEHLFTIENQFAMAREVQRVARAYWVQTPNYWFPMEPHFHVPGWQWLPESSRVSLLQRRRVRDGACGQAHTIARGEVAADPASLAEVEGATRPRAARRVAVESRGGGDCCAPSGAEETRSPGGRGTVEIGLGYASQLAYAVGAKWRFDRKNFLNGHVGSMDAHRNIPRSRIARAIANPATSWPRAVQ